MTVPAAAAVKHHLWTGRENPDALTFHNIIIFIQRFYIYTGSGARAAAELPCVTGGRSATSYTQHRWFCMSHMFRGHSTWRWSCAEGVSTFILQVRSSHLASAMSLGEVITP